MYTLVTTFSPSDTVNVGDRLITESAREILRNEKDEEEFVTFFRGEDAEPYLDDINASRALILPGFAVREPLIRTYRLLDVLDRIEVPIVPLGGGTKIFPGDPLELHGFRYGTDTVAGMQRIHSMGPGLTSRDVYSQQIFANHGFSDVPLTGDCGWFDADSLGQDMHRPEEIQRLAFSPPNDPIYADQARELMRQLAERFPNARRICAFHGAMRDVDQPLAAEAEALGYEVRDLAAQEDPLALYDHIDLHVGYRCHGHISALRKRRPSILLHEDSRGSGFSATFGVGGFNAHTRAQALFRDPHPLVRRIGRVLRHQVGIQRSRSALPDPLIPTRVMQFIEQQLGTRFRSYIGLAPFLDETYEQGMQSYLAQIP